MKTKARPERELSGEEEMPAMSRSLLRSILAFALGMAVAWLLLSEQESVAKRAMNIPVPTETVQERPDTTRIEPAVTLLRDSFLVGIVAPAEKIDLVASDGGRVLALTIALGGAVRQGELLAEIALADLDYLRLAQAARLRETEVAMERSRLELAVAQRKWARRDSSRGVFSAEALEETQLQLEMADLDLKAAQARHTDAQAELDRLVERIGRRRIVAPIDGLVTARYVDPGATVDAGQAILQVVPSADRLVRFAAPAHAWERYSQGVAVEVATDSAREAACATVERISPTLDQGSRYVFMEARLAGDRLRELPFGTTVEVRLAEAICA